MRNAIHGRPDNLDAATRELIEELAVNHGLAVGPQDPVLAMHTVAIRAIHNAGQAMQAQMKELQQEITRAQAQVLEEHRAQVEKDACKVVNRVTESVTKAVDKKKIADHIRYEVDEQVRWLFAYHRKTMDRHQFTLCVMVVCGYLVAATPSLIELYQRFFS